MLAALLMIGYGSMAVAAQSAESRWYHEQIDGASLQTESYRNVDYGFSMPLLPGISAYGTTPPNPNHGLNYLLGYRRVIFAWAEFDVMFYGNQKNQLKHVIQDWHIARPVKVSPINIDNHFCDYVRGHKKHKQIESIICFHHDESDILYYLVLETDASHQQADHQQLMLLARQFKFIPRD